MLTCGRCGQSAEYDGDASQEVLRCDDCGARIAFGVLMPRIVNEPHPNPRFITSRIETVVDGQPVSIALTLDKEFALMYARDIASIAER